MKLNRRYIILLLLPAILLLSSCSKGAPFELLSEKVKDNVYLAGSNVGGLDRSELSRTVKRMAENIDLRAKNAVLDQDKWIVKIHDEAGRRVNVRKTLAKLLKAREGEQFELVVEEVKPSVTTEDLRANIVQIGIFSTPLRDKTPGRIKNIRLAAVKLDFVKLMPGDEFSFNNVVGKRTPAKGFEEAPIIIKTPEGPKKDNEVGGGVCQVTTTLYNAVVQCGLDITERHLHSGKVTYAPKGQDATVYFGSVDFKFKNNRSYPIMLRTNMDNRSVTVKVFENRN